MLHAGFSAHPDFSHIRGLGSSYYDTTSEPGRLQATTVQNDANQSRSEWVDVDMEMEAKLNDGYAKVRGRLSWSVSKCHTGERSALRGGC